MAEDATIQAAAAAQQQQQQQQQQKHKSSVKRGPFAWLRRLRAHHKQQQHGQQQQQLHRLGSLEVASSSGDLQPLAPEVLDQLSASANVWALASHLYWGIWAIIQVG
jgi:hypothetical protein